MFVRIGSVLLGSVALLVLIAGGASAQAVDTEFANATIGSVPGFALGNAANVFGLAGEASDDALNASRDIGDNESAAQASIEENASVMSSSIFTAVTTGDVDAVSGSARSFQENASSAATTFQTQTVTNVQSLGAPAAVQGFLTNERTAAFAFANVTVLNATGFAGAGVGNASAFGSGAASVALGTAVNGSGLGFAAGNSTFNLANGLATGNFAQSLENGTAIVSNGTRDAGTFRDTRLNQTANASRSAQENVSSTLADTTSTAGIITGGTQAAVIGGASGGFDTATGTLVFGSNAATGAVNGALVEIAANLTSAAGTAQNVATGARDGAALTTDQIFRILREM